MEKHQGLKLPLFADEDTPKLLPCQLCGRKVLYVVMQMDLTFFVHGPRDWCILDKWEGRTDG